MAWAESKFRLSSGPPTTHAAKRRILWELQSIRSALIEHPLPAQRISVMAYTTKGYSTDPGTLWRRTVALLRSARIIDENEPKHCTYSLFTRAAQAEQHIVIVSER